MSKRNHLRLLGNRQLSEIAPIEFKYGFGKKPEDDVDEVEVKEPNYQYMAQRLDLSYKQFVSDKNEKQVKRDLSIVVPETIDYIRIYFLDQFVLKDFFDKWYDEFGLETVVVESFGKEVLFAVADKDKFEVFVNSVLQFVRRGLHQDLEADFSNKITYIDSFKLLTSSDIIRFDMQHTVMSWS